MEMGGFLSLALAAKLDDASVSVSHLHTVAIIILSRHRELKHPHRS